MGAPDERGEGSADEPTPAEGPTGAEDRVGVPERRNRFDTYLTVLALLVATFMFGMAVPDEGWSRFVSTVLQGASLAATLAVSRARPRVQRVAAVLIVAAAAASATGWITGTDTGEGLSNVITGLLTALGPYVVFRGVGRRSLRIDMETVVAALCIYLMIGLFYAYVFAAIQSFGEPFFVQTPDGTRAELLYFSFVTLTTTGFGDFSAASNVGRAFTVSEAILGQVYLVTVVALIVGNLGREPTRRIRPPSPGGAG